MKKSTRKISLLLLIIFIISFVGCTPINKTASSSQSVSHSTKNESSKKSSSKKSSSKKSSSKKSSSKKSSSGKSSSGKSSSKKSSSKKSSSKKSSSSNSSASSNQTNSYEKIENFEPHTFVYSEGIKAYGYYDIGNCRKLLGEVYTLVIFLDDNVSSWDDETRDTFYHKKFFPSINYINEQADLRDVDLNLNCGQYATTSDHITQPKYKGVIEPDITNTINNIDIFNQVCLALGFPDKRVLHGYLQNYTGCEQIAYVIVLNKAGRAYAVSDTSYDDNDSIEFVVAFSKSTSGVDDIGSSIIHEMLHLFGATDFYDPRGYYPERKKLCKELYPNDIMMRSAVDPDELSIGRLTECLIGWSDYFPPECDCPEWWETDVVISHRPPASSSE